MPHFENIDQYETRKTRNGRKQIVPIAPHSLQAAEYRPEKKAHPKPEEKIKTSSFDDVEFEPVSIRQMEKEFRQAGRSIQRPRQKKMKLSKRISKFFKNLLSLVTGKKNTKRGKRKPAPRYRQSDRKPRSGDRGKQNQRSAPKGKRRSRNRSGRNPQDQRDRNRNPSQSKDGKNQDGPHKDGPKQENRRKPQRSRRRKRPPNPSQQNRGPRRDSSNKDS